MKDLASSHSNDAAENQAVLPLLDWKRAHAELVGLAHKQAGLDREIGRWLLYARRAATHSWLGYGSIHEYAQQLFGFTSRQTQERLRVAEALEELSMLDSAFEQGKLCWSAVRELTRVATPETESKWLAASNGRSAHQIEDMVTGHAPGDDPQDRVNVALLRRVLRFELSPATYATVQEALTKIRRDAGGRLNDDEALLLMARHVLGGPRDEGRSSYQIAVSICPSCERGFQHARGELVELSSAAVEVACCDAQHIGEVRAEAGACTRVGVCGDTRRGEVRSEQGEGADKAGAKKAQPSRARQKLPPRMRRLVLRRARHVCEVPTCTNSAFLDVHHRTLRSEGGTHDQNELVVLCGAHHAALHDGRLVIAGDAATGWVFRHADGTAYGAPATAQQVDVSVKVFRGLCSLGFKQGEARRALDHVTQQMQPHVGTAMTAERMLRDALRVLTHRRHHS
jgi:hypothetical protein